jgi:hypothetical protein
MEGAKMRGYLKAAGTIEQCTKCYALRDLMTEPAECASCQSLLGIKHTETRSLALSDVSHDVEDKPTLVMAVQASKAATA